MSAAAGVLVYADEVYLPMCWKAVNDTATTKGWNHAAVTVKIAAMQGKIESLRARAEQGGDTAGQEKFRMYEGVVSRAVALCKGGQIAFTLDHEYFTQRSYVESQDPTIAASAQCANAAASLADPSQLRRRARRTADQ